MSQEPTAVCRDVREAIRSASGVALTMFSGADCLVVVETDGPLIAWVEELQINFGQGPSFDAVHTSRPVLVDDLGATAATLRWAAFTVQARRHGVAALFSYPVLIDRIPVAVLDVCRDRPGPLSVKDKEQMSAYAIAIAALLGNDPVTDDSRLDRATGMVMGQIGTNAAAASRRLRRYASGQDRPLVDVVDDVLTGQLTF